MCVTASHYSMKAVRFVMTYERDGVVGTHRLQRLRDQIHQRPVTIGSLTASLQQQAIGRANSESGYLRHTETPR